MSISKFTTPAVVVVTLFCPSIAVRSLIRFVSVDSSVDQRLLTLSSNLKFCHDLLSSCALENFFDFGSEINQLTVEVQSHF